MEIWVITQVVIQMGNDKTEPAALLSQCVTCGARDGRSKVFEIQRSSTTICKNSQQTAAAAAAAAASNVT